MKLHRSLFAVVLTTVLIASAAQAQWPGRSDQRWGENERSAGTQSGCSVERNVAEPRIEVTSDAPAGIAARTNRLKGYIEGVCISEAGLYMNGSRIRSINVTTLPSFKRFEFDLNVPPGQRRELRVYNIQGGRAAYALQDSAQDQDELGLGARLPEDDEQPAEDEQRDDERF